MIVILAGIILGVALGIVFPFAMPSYLTPYIGAALLVCFDTISGGFCADAYNKFTVKMFISGFFINTFLACLIIFIGDILGIDLIIAVIVVFGTKLFNNFSKMRQKLLQKSTKECKIEMISSDDKKTN